MKHATVLVSTIRSDDTTFDFYRPDLFHEREGELPDDPKVLTQVILREIPDSDEYQIVFGHKIIEKLPDAAEVPATIYSAAELPDQECGCVILEYDRNVGAQLLTHYERVCVIRKLGITAYRVHMILGVSDTQVHNWIKGAGVYDELLKSQSFDAENLCFSHLIELANQALRFEKVEGEKLDSATKEQYLKKCSEEEFSVSQFRRWLEAELGLVEVDTPTGCDKGEPVEEPVDLPVDDEVEDKPDTEQQKLIDEFLLQFELSELVTITHKGGDTLKITAPDISTDLLPELARCLESISESLQLKAAA